LSALTK